MILFKVFCEYKWLMVHRCGDTYSSHCEKNQQKSFTIRCESLKFNIRCNCQSQLKLNLPPPLTLIRHSVKTFVLNFKYDSCDYGWWLCKFSGKMQTRRYSRQTLSTFQKLKYSVSHWNPLRSHPFFEVGLDSRKKSRSNSNSRLRRSERWWNMKLKKKELQE